MWSPKAEKYFENKTVARVPNIAEVESTKELRELGCCGSLAILLLMSITRGMEMIPVPK